MFAGDCLVAVNHPRKLPLSQRPNYTQSSLYVIPLECRENKKTLSALRILKVISSRLPWWSAGDGFRSAGDALGQPLENEPEWSFN
jgi:hypothetical protein